MAFKVIKIIIIAAVIADSLAEPPVRIDEQHLRVSDSQGNGNGWQDSVPGLPGKDYPNLSSIPKTSFSCAGKTPGGYYADVETRCQVFHVCNTEGTKSSFLCPSGSIFNQRHFVCDWWYDFECERAPDFYSLNDALDDRERTPDQSESDRYTPNAPLPYNSIGASNNDLSLASSGYPNNLRDEANLIYEDYVSGKIIDAGGGNSIPDKPVSGASVASIGTYVVGAGASGLSNADNYLGAYRKEPAESGTDYRRGKLENSNEDRRYRGRPNHLSDNVPRGFSKSPAEHLKRNDTSPGFFVNNGLFDERDKNQDNILLRDRNNLIDNQYSNESNRSKEKTSANNDNFNYNYKNTNTVRYGIYYQNPDKYPLPQENNNYVNNDSKSEINSNYQYNNVNINRTFENYSENSERYKSSEKTSTRYENYSERYKEKSDSVKSVESSSSSSIYDFTGEPYNRILEYAATTARAVSSAPTEDEVDREWQRVVDSTELKRNAAQRPNRDYDYETGGSFFIREESAHPWRSDLTTSSSGLSSHPPYPPELLDFSTLSRPEELTTPTANERPKFLGSRPTAGLPSGVGNGLPGVNKVLAGSVSITGKPAEDASSTI